MVNSTTTTNANASASRSSRSRRRLVALLVLTAAAGVGVQAASPPLPSSSLRRHLRARRRRRRNQCRRQATRKECRQEKACRWQTGAGNGKCEPRDAGIDDSSACNTRLPNTCPEGKFCLDKGNAAGACTGRGQCVTRPQSPFCSKILLPVCGCDGKIYSNACVARSRGASVSKDKGVCRQEPI